MRLLYAYKFWWLTLLANWLRKLSNSVQMMAGIARFMAQTPIEGKLKAPVNDETLFFITGRDGKVWPGWFDDKEFVKYMEQNKDVIRVATSIANFRRFAIERILEEQKGE